MKASRQGPKKIIPEFLKQLNDDILYCGWLCQIVRLQNPAFTDRECLDAALDAVLVLHHEGKIAIGDAHDTDGIVRIQPWPESNDELRIRLESVIANSKDQDRPFCFWVQLMKHVGA